MDTKETFDNAPIGVFDSGLGGLTAVRELRRLLPGEDIVYFGDTGRVPYGSRGTDTIVQYAKQDIAFLLEMYCSASIEKTVEWVTTGMERPIPELVDLLIEAMPQRLQELLSDLGK